jgi:hypothetical protein
VIATVYGVVVAESGIVDQLAPLNDQPQGRPCLEQRARRQDLYFNRDDLAGGQLLLAAVGVPGLQRCRPLGVELTL